jgi:hypothetical protein
MTTRLLVDIETYNSGTGVSTKQGPGPIVSATNWQQTARLNRAGEFSFSMPATDAMAAYVRPKSYARCWHADGSGMRCLGYGRIERVELRESEQGPLLDVSGMDLLGELGDRIIADRKSIRAEIEEHPAYVTGATTEASNSTLKMYDNLVSDTTTYARLECDDLAGTPFVIGSPYKFHKISVNLGTEVNNTHTVTCQYSSDDTWKSLTVTDGTSGFAADGDITFTPPTDWEPATGEILYKVKINFTGGDAGETVDIQDISVTYYGPTNTALADIIAYAPTGWSFDGDGYSTLQNRPLSGTELVANAGFETYTSGGGNESFTSWTNVIAGTANINADTTNKHGGSASCKLTTTGATGGSTDTAYVYQDMTVTGTTEYKLTFWTRGDGTNDGQWRISDKDISGPDGYITNTLDTNVTGTTWTQVTQIFVTPATTTTLRLLFFSPIVGSGAYALFDDVSLQAGGGNSIYLQCSDESVLEMLIRCSEVSGENFILSPHALDATPQRKVLWLGKDETDCGIEAVSFVDPVAAADNQFIALITAITEIEDASEIVSRVYPYGSGMGGSRVTLASCTTQPPTGYVLSTTGNYIERTATTTALGTRVEVAKSWTDIVQQTGDTTAAAQNAANILMIQAVNWLETHSCTSLDRLTGDVPRFFELSITKCETMIYPGYQIRVRHHRFVDGYHAVSIDRDLWITAATWRVDRSGVQTVGLEVATVPRAAINDALATATSIRRIIGIQAHNTAVGY